MPETSASVPSDGPASDATPLQSSEYPAATPGMGVPVRLSDVEFVPLIHERGVVGAFFPLDQAEVAVVQSAFKAGAGKPGVYSLVSHGRDGGLWVRRRSDSRVVKLDASGVWRLLRGLVVQGGGAWSDMPDVWIVSCWVDDPARDGFLGQVRELARDADYPGVLSSTKDRARVRKDNPEIEELDGEPPGPFKGGVGFDENGVPYVDLATPGGRGWHEEQTMAGPSRLAGSGGSTLDDLVRVSPVERHTRLSGQVPDTLPDIGMNGSVVASWRGELGPGVGGGWSAEADAELAVFVQVFVRISVLLDAEGREPLDVALVMRGAAEGGWERITSLEERLKNGLWNAGLNPDMVHSLFDRVGLGVADGEASSVGVMVRESPNRQVSGYRGARTLQLSFLPGRAELTKASRRRLEWLAQGVVLRWVDRVESWLVLEVPRQDKALVEAEVKAAVQAAAGLWAPDTSVTSLAEIYVEFRVPREPGVVLRIEGDVHYLDSMQIEPDLSLTWHEQIPATLQEQPVRSAAKRKVTWPTPAPETSVSAVTPESAAAPDHDTAFNLPEAEGTTLWLLNDPKTARRDAIVVDRWHTKPTPGPPALSEEDRKSMSEFARRLLRRKPAEGGVPWDIQVHVTETRYWSKKNEDDWFKRLKEDLKAALMEHGVHEYSDLLKFDFDHIKHWEDRRRGILPSVDVFVYDTAGKTIKEYQDAQEIELIFVPHREDLVASSRRKLHWRLEGIARIADRDESDQSRLMLNLRSRERIREGRAKWVSREVEAAARNAYPGKSDEEINTFVKKRTKLVYGEARGQGLFVGLIRQLADTSASLWDSPGGVAEQSVGESVTREVRKEWKKQVVKDRWEARKKTREDLSEAPGADAVTAWLLNGKTARIDAKVVDGWHAKPPESGPPALSGEGKKSMSEFAGRLLRREPAEGGVPWDIQLHLTEIEKNLTYSRLQEWFRLLEEELKAALMEHGVSEDSDLLKFDFDHIKHLVKGNNGIFPSVDILVYDTAGQMIREYQNAPRLELIFVPYREDLVASSRRKLHWRVEGLARIVDRDESDRSLLVLKLRSMKSAREGLVKSVSREVKAAARNAYPEKSDEEIEAFIAKRVLFVYLTLRGRRVLSVDLKRLDLSALASIQNTTGDTQPVPFSRGTPAVTDRTNEGMGGERSDGEESQAGEAPGVRREVEPGGWPVPNVAEPLSWPPQDALWPDDMESLGGEPEGRGPDWGEWPYGSFHGGLFGLEEDEYSRLLGFASPGTGDPVPLSDVVGGEHEVEFGELTDGSGAV
ncbi:hypothetical protein [Amycolatopsis japonica]